MGTFVFSTAVDVSEGELAEAARVAATTARDLRNFPPMALAGLHRALVGPTPPSQGPTALLSFLAPDAPAETAAPPAAPLVARYRADGIDVAGFLAWDDGAPIARVRVRVSATNVRKSLVWVDTRTDADGTFRAELAGRFADGAQVLAIPAQGARLGAPARPDADPEALLTEARSYVAGRVEPPEPEEPEEPDAAVDGWLLWELPPELVRAVQSERRPTGEVVGLWAEARFQSWLRSSADLSPPPLHEIWPVLQATLSDVDLDRQRVWVAWPAQG